MVDTPTLDELRVRYPTLGSVDDDLLLAIIDEATILVTDDWYETTQVPAIMAYVAHTVLCGDRLETRRSVGDVTVEYSTPVESQDFGSTSPGRLFLRLRALNSPAVYVL